LPPGLGPLIRHQPTPRLPRRCVTGRVRGGLRCPADRPEPGWNPITRASTRPSGLQVRSGTAVPRRASRSPAFTTVRPSSTSHAFIWSWLAASSPQAAPRPSGRWGPGPSRRSTPTARRSAGPHRHRGQGRHRPRQQRNGGPSCGPSLQAARSSAGPHPAPTSGAPLGSHTHDPPEHGHLSDGRWPAKVASPSGVP
jgi:hypothetical protein